MTKGSAFGIILVTAALGAATVAISDGNVPAMILLLFLTPIVTAAVYLSARRHRQ